jgi:hypothetical protein
MTTSEAGVEEDGSLIPDDEYPGELWKCQDCECTLRDHPPNTDSACGDCGHPVRWHVSIGPTGAAGELD